MNFKAKLNKVLESLGFTKKFENKSLTADEYKALCEAYQKEYQSTLMDDLAAENSAAEQAEHQKQINELYAIVSKANKSRMMILTAMEVATTMMMQERRTRTARMYRSRNSLQLSTLSLRI